MSKCEAEPNLTVLLNTEILEPVLEDNRITGLKVLEKTEEGGTKETIYPALTLIDATVDADVPPLPVCRIPWEEKTMARQKRYRGYLGI